MALTHIGPVEMETAPGVVARSNDPTLHYDAYSDELIFRLRPSQGESFAFPVNDVLSLLIDDATGEVVGFQIDTFATFAVHQVPALQAIAKIASIVPRSPDDLLLYREGRVARYVADVSPEDEAAFKEVIRHIVSHTGGVDPDIELVHDDR